MDTDTASPFTKFDTGVEKLFFGERVDDTHKFAGMEIDGFVALLEFVQFFENRNRYNDIVVLELVDASAVVQNDIGIENEDFTMNGHTRQITKVCTTHKEWKQGQNKKPALQRVLVWTILDLNQ